MKKKQNFIDDEELVLNWLLHKQRDTDNTVRIGAGNYIADGITQERCVQVLCALQDNGWIKLNFRGCKGPNTFCFVTLNEQALTYFEDQEQLELEAKHKTLHDYKVQGFSALVGGIIGFILGRLS